jgi:hypothetical protein
VSRDGDTQPLPPYGQREPRRGREDCTVCAGFGARFHDGSLIPRKQWNAALWTLGNLSGCLYCNGTGYKPGPLRWTPGRAAQLPWMGPILYVLFGGMLLVAILAMATGF